MMKKAIILCSISSWQYLITEGTPAEVAQGSCCHWTHLAVLPSAKAQYSLCLFISLEIVR
jgi:hypothetical protein